MHKYFLFCFITLFAACASEDDIPANIIPLDKMKFISWDMLRASEYAKDQFAKDSATKTKKTLTLYQQVFKIYAITKDQFYESTRYYQSHPDKNKILLDSIAEYAARKRQDLYKKIQ